MTDCADKFQKLVAIIADLRDPDTGCPWDIKQTHESLKPFLIEEAYETIDSIDNDGKGLSEELGDVLLQVLLHSQIGKDAGTFDISEVIELLTEKLIERHPHVFGDTKVTDAEEVTKNWEAIKKEKKQSKESVVDGVPKAMPALLRAHAIGHKVARVGFDWENIGQVKEKVFEELGELIAELNSREQDQSKIKEEFGDLLFSLAQLARKMDFDPELLLKEANEKFCCRFRKMEELAAKDLTKFSAIELEELWQKIK